MYMDICISTQELHFLIRQAAEMGANFALAETGKIKPFLNKSEAFRRYGRKQVENWVARGLIRPIKDGEHSASWRIERMELEAIVKSHLLLKIF